MDRKTKHRILGILVVIGLVIILLPLFQGRKEIRNDTAQVSNAPPFPDQTIQVASANAEQEPTVTNQETGIPQTIVNATNDNDNEIKLQPDDTINVIHPSVINHAPTINNIAAKPSVIPAIKTKEKPVVTTEDKANSMLTAPKPSSPKLAENSEAIPDALPPTTNHEIKKLDDDSDAIPNVVSTEGKTKKKPIKAVIFKHIEKNTNSNMVRSAANATTHTASIKPRLVPIKNLDEDGLAKLKGAVWVIQIGSYKNKTNALRVANQLRANGYSAFIQQISTALGEQNTRVFVGPETKRSSALALADKLQSEMHIQGIVISYKPLTL